MNLFKSFIYTISLFMAACSTLTSCKDCFTEAEIEIIRSQREVMNVLTIDNPEEMNILRNISINIQDKVLQSSDYELLVKKMISTVTDSSQDGVGLAGPQVGINRRVVAVQRFDKEGEPFEVYANISLEPIGKEMAEGEEGCLSVPGLSGTVSRYKSVRITYTDPSTLEIKSEEINDFTAVIFQHECDHLEGILFIDKATKITNKDQE